VCILFAVLLVVINVLSAIYLSNSNMV